MIIVGSNETGHDFATSSGPTAAFLALDAVGQPSPIAAAKAARDDKLDFDATELQWLAEILRGHQEAVQQLRDLGPEVSSEMTAELARRQMVLGSQGFTELVQLITAHGKDMARYREHKHSMSLDENLAFEWSTKSRLEAIRARIASIRYLLDGVSERRQKES